MADAAVLPHIAIEPFKFDDGPVLTIPFSRDELVSKLSRSNKFPSPGPSGLCFSDQLISCPVIDSLCSSSSILYSQRPDIFWKIGHVT